jgi:hypothetical protein
MEALEGGGEMTFDGVPDAASETHLLRKEILRLSALNAELVEALKDAVPFIKNEPRKHMTLAFISHVEGREP